MTDYKTLRLRHAAEFAQAIPVAMDQIAWPEDRLRDEQTRLLRTVPSSAKNLSSWHAERLRDVDAATFELSDLASLPTMSKDDLLGNFDAILTDPRLSRDLVEAHVAALTDDAYLLDEFHAVASGGSSGVRGLFVFGWDAWKTATLGMLRLRMSSAARMGIPREAFAARWPATRPPT